MNSLTYTETSLWQLLAGLGYNPNSKFGLYSVFWWVTFRKCQVCRLGWKVKQIFSRGQQWQDTFILLPRKLHKYTHASNTWNHVAQRILYFYMRYSFIVFLKKSMYKGTACTVESLYSISPILKRTSASQNTLKKVRS